MLVYHQMVDQRQSVYILFSNCVVNLLFTIGHVCRTLLQIFNLIINGSSCYSVNDKSMA